MYKRIADVSVIRVLDGAVIPCSESNRDYQEYLLWVEKGNTPEEVQPLLPVPEEVTMRQAQLVLLQDGLLDEVESIIEGIADTVVKRTAQVEWRTSSTVKRSHSLVTQIAPLLGLTESDLDSLFIRAKAIP